MVKGNPGIITWSQGSFFSIDTTFYVISRGLVKSMYYLFYVLLSQNLSSLGADSAVPGLNRNLAYMNKIIIPNTVLIELFDACIQSVYKTIYNNDKQNQFIVDIRDLLLPKLMSGKIRIPII